MKTAVEVAVLVEYEVTLSVMVTRGIGAVDAGGAVSVKTEIAVAVVVVV